MRTFRWGSGARWRAILLALMVPLVATGAIFISQDPRPLLVTIAATLLVGQVFIRCERRGTAARKKDRSTLDAVMHGATDGILVVDCDGRVGFVNPMFRVPRQPYPKPPVPTARGSWAATRVGAPPSTLA